MRYGGITGKIAALGIVFFLVLCFLSVAARSSPILLGAILIAALLGLVFVILRIEAIFKSNPEMATLEGTEVIRYRQAEMKSKNHDPIRVIDITTDPELPIRTTGPALGRSKEAEEEE